MQLQAGYIIESLPQLFSGKTKSFVEKLAYHLSAFELITINDLSVKNLDPYAVTIHNIISRGNPTIAPTFIEDIISATFLKTRKQSKPNNSFEYTFINDELKEEIFRSLHIIDPRIKINDLKKLYTFDNDPEAKLKKQLIFDIIPSQIGPYFIHLLQFNRSFKSIFQNYGQKALELINKLAVASETIDLSVELPYCDQTNTLGIAIEIEKKLLEDQSIISLEQKNNLFKQINWDNILYLKQIDFELGQVDITPLINLSYEQYFDTLRKNYERPLYSNISGLDALQITLTPFEVARIQKTIISYILAGKLDLSQPVWEIAVVERDIPGAFLAVQDLKNQFENLYKLTGKKDQFPEIELSLFYTEQFEQAELNILYQGQKNLISEFDPQKKYDLLIDSSILRYAGLDPQPLDTETENYAILRSAKFINSKPKFLAAEPLKFKKFYSLDKNLSKQQTKNFKQLQQSLLYFVKNIFRYYQLSDIQLQALNSILSKQNTLLNLPFIYEKTLIYQIASLLQSGLTLVITPFYSVLKDQQRKLSKYRILTHDFIHSMLLNKYDYLEQLDTISSGSFLMLFISAEVFHSNNFRKILKLIYNRNLQFNLIVIDQISSFSIWSHSHNYSYVSLPQNFKNLLPNYQNITILGLSSCSSYDAIIDIQKSFNISPENTITQTFKNTNLDIKIIFTSEKNTVTQRKLKPENIFQNKLQKLTDLNIIKPKTLIYSHLPDKVYDYLNSQLYNLNIGLFNGQIRLTNFVSSIWACKINYQNFFNFVNNDLDALVANRLIAYGLDKPDIRNLILLSLPFGTAEFYKLINRAARDLQKSNIFILLDQTYVYYEKINYIVSANQITQIKETKETIYDEFYTSKLYEFINSNLLKEFNIINELFNSLEPNKDTLQDLLINRVFQQFNSWIRFEPQPLTDPYMLYIYDDEELLGILDFNKNQISNQASIQKKQLADNILTFLDSEIRAIVSNPKDIFLLLNETISSTNVSGIYVKLASIKEGQHTTLNISFYNNVPQKIADLFPNSQLTKKQIIQIYYASLNYDDFKNNLKNFVDKKSLRKNDETLQNLYYSIRTFSDTYKIISYLYQIGIISDYIIDYRNQQFIVIIKKLSDELYLNNIYKLILPFIFKNRALEVFEKIPRFEGENLVQKTVNYWASFIHNFVIQKFLNSISELSKIITQNSNNPNNILDYFQFFYTAKYYLKLKQIEQQNFDLIKVIENFINEAGIFKDNWFHLQNSAKLILKQNPNSYLAKALLGWTTLILSKDNNQISQALDSIAASLNMWRIQTNAPAEQFLQKINDFFSTLDSFDPDLKAKTENLFSLKIITSWLKQFNNSFIDIT